MQLHQIALLLIGHWYNCEMEGSDVF
jgi:hypothetical protein